MRARAAFLIAASLTLGACTNPEVPAGYEGYVYHVPLVFGEMEYRDALRGPASTGLSWRLFVDTIDMRERNFPEQFELLSSDDLKVQFEVNTRVRLRPGSVRKVVEEWGGESWYDWRVKEPLRTVVRKEVMKVSATQIQLKTDAVAKLIKRQLEKLYGDTPVEILSVDIGQFEFPKEVTQAIQEKIAKQQELERQQYILAKTEKEAEIHVLEALRVAEQQKIIGETLDPLYVQRQAVQVYRQLAESPNRTVMVLPSTDDGTALPLVKSSGKRRPISAADAAFLAEVREKYLGNSEIPEAIAPSIPAVSPGGLAGPEAAAPKDPAAANAAESSDATAPSATPLDDAASEAPPAEQAVPRKSTKPGKPTKPEPAAR